ncbi:MAG: hypothetical protein ACE5FB_06440, partial [Candidatus Binatia bacterium]
SNRSNRCRGRIESYPVSQKESAVNDKIVMGKRGRFGKYGEKKRLERLKGAQRFSPIASRRPKKGISRSCRGPDGSKR